MHEFFEELKYSQDQSGNIVIEDFYKKYFPNLEEIKIVEDISLNKKGVDKIIVLKNNKEIYIEEKIRGYDYGDILLEEWSVYRNGKGEKKGWVGDPNKISDYIVYIVLPKIYIFPYSLLQLVWRENWNIWVNKAKCSRDVFQYKFAENRGYITTNIAVPTQILLEAIRNKMSFNVNEPELIS